MENILVRIKGKINKWEFEKVENKLYSLAMAGIVLMLIVKLPKCSQDRPFPLPLGKKMQWKGCGLRHGTEVGSNPRYIICY